MAIRSPSMSSEFSQGASSVPGELDRCVLSPTAPLPLDLQDCPALHNFSIRPASDTRYESAFSTVARSLLRSSSQQMTTRTISSSLKVAMQASSRRSSSVSGVLGGSTEPSRGTFNRSASYEKGGRVQGVLLLKEKLGQVLPERSFPAALYGVTDQAESQSVPSSSASFASGISDTEFAKAAKDWKEKEDDKVRSIVDKFIQNSSPRLRAVQVAPSTPSSRNKTLIRQRIAEMEREKENMTLLEALPFVIEEEVVDYPKPMGFVRRRDPDVSADRLPNETYEQYLDRVFPVSKETYPREHIDLEPPATEAAVEAFIKQHNQAPQETIPVFGSVRTIVSEELPASGLNESVAKLLARFCPKIPDPTFERIDEG